MAIILSPAVGGVIGYFWTKIGFLVDDLWTQLQTWWFFRQARTTLEKERKKRGISKERRAEIDRDLETINRLVATSRMNRLYKVLGSQPDKPSES